MHRDIKSENCFVIIDTVGMSKSFNSTSKSMKRYVLGKKKKKNKKEFCFCNHVI